MSKPSSKTASKVLGFAVIGCGRVSPKHLEAISHHPQAKLVAVCDVKADRAEQAARRYRTKAYTSFEEVLKLPEVDVVTICTPSGLHPKLGMQAAQAGKHVIVEKPIGVTVAAAHQLIAACEKAQVKLCVILQNRFNQPMLELKELIDSQRLGDIYLANVCVRWFRAQSYYEDEWHGTRALDGGVLMNQSIHHIDALIWLLGMPKRVRAYTGTLAHQMEMEDTATAILEFPNGALATIEASTVTYPENLEGSVAVFGSQGSVKVGGTALNKWVIYKVAGHLDEEVELLAHQPGDPDSVYGYSHPKVIDDMIQAILNDRQPLTHGLEGTRSLRVVEAMYTSAATGKDVELKETL